MHHYLAYVSYMIIIDIVLVFIFNEKLTFKVFILLLIVFSI